MARAASGVCLGSELGLGCGGRTAQHDWLGCAPGCRGAALSLAGRYYVGVAVAFPALPLICRYVCPLFRPIGLRMVSK